MTTRLAWQCGSASDAGRERSANEDRIYADPERGVFVIADGLGGHAGGDRAAEIAVETIAREIDPEHGALESEIRRVITLANQAIFEASQREIEMAGMACVLTLAVIHGETLYAGHVGDTRLYLLWNGSIRKLTSDHSPVGELEDLGQLTESQAMYHPRRNEVFRDVGSREWTANDEWIEIRTIPLHPAAALLLCSDGLSDSLTSSRIGEIADTYDGDPDRVACRLVDAANEAGGRDNISVIFIAGPDYVGMDSPSAQDARVRHAITRQRRARWTWRFLGSRLLWLMVGFSLGIALVLAAQRFGGFRL